MWSQLNEQQKFLESVFRWRYTDSFLSTAKSILTLFKRYPIFICFTNVLIYHCRSFCPSCVQSFFINLWFICVGQNNWQQNKCCHNVLCCQGLMNPLWNSAAEMNQPMSLEWWMVNDWIGAAYLNSDLIGQINFAHQNQSFSWELGRQNKHRTHAGSTNSKRFYLDWNVNITDSPFFRYWISYRGHNWLFTLSRNSIRPMLNSRHLHIHHNTKVFSFIGHLKALTFGHENIRCETTRKPLKQYQFSFNLLMDINER